MPYLIGIDVGTSGAKTVLFDTKGNVVTKSVIEYPLEQPHPGWSEQEPENWWKATVKSIRKVLQRSKINSAEVKGISLSGQMHGAVFLDKNLRPVRPCILWNDQRTVEQCQTIIEKIGLDKLRELVGNTALSGFTAPKILWLRDCEPEHYARVNKLVLPKDYVRYKLTGVLATEVSDASGTILFDNKQRTWSSEMLQRLDINPDWFPNCYESDSVCGEITKKVALTTGLKVGTPVIAGGADNTCSAIGNGIILEGRVLASIGTSGVIFCHTDTVKVDPKLRVHSFCHSVRYKWYLMGCMLSAGFSFRWFRDQLGVFEKQIAKKRKVDPYEILTEAASLVPVGSNGVIFLPYLMGERSPHGDPNAKSVFFGITAKTTREDLIRAVLEGVTFGMRDSLEIMRELRQPIQQIRVTGGGAQSGLWRQICADIFNTPVVTVNTTEGAALGAAILAGVGAGVYPDIATAVERIVTVTSVTDPILENSKRYNEFYQIFKGLYPALKPAFDQISAIITEKLKH
ncbi:MAG: xylulokinase [bacterium]|nr:xylulokinase [bacterium]